MKVARARVNLNTNPVCIDAPSLANAFRTRMNRGLNVTGSFVTSATDGPVGTDSYFKGVLGVSPNTYFTAPLTLSTANNWSEDTRGFPVKPGETYTFSIYSRQVNGTSNGTSSSLKINYRNAQGVRAGTTSGPQSPVVYMSPGDGWVRHTATFTVPNEPTIAYMSGQWEGYFRNDTPAGTELHHGAALVEKEPNVLQFFSGDTPNAVWDGVAKLSTSTIPYFTEATSINVWNGVAWQPAQLKRFNGTEWVDG